MSDELSISSGLDTSEPIPLTLRYIPRLCILTEPIVPGQFLFCNDTHESFFDENTVTRIAFGRMDAVSLELDLPAPEVSVGSFIIVEEDMSVRYCTEEDGWIIVETREQMSKILGGWENFIPFNLLKNGRLIAPRTLTSCVYNVLGISIDEILDSLMEFNDRLETEGLDAKLITSGVLDFERIPKEARMDFVAVQNKQERYALTTEKVQKEDVVQEADTGNMYFVVDDTKLDSEEGYQPFTVGNIPWQHVTNRPISLTLKNGAVGSVSFTTGATMDSQKLTIEVSLNVDHVDNGVLSIEHGGTGNKVGKAKFVEYTQDDANTGKLVVMMADDTLATSGLIDVQGGIISASAFRLTDDNLASVLNNLKTDKIVFDKVNGSKSITTKDGDKEYNVWIYSSNANSFGDSKVPTKVYGKKTTIRGTESVQIQIGDEGNSSGCLSIESTKVSSNVPVSIAEKVSIDNNDIISGSIGTLFTAEGNAVPSSNVNLNNLASVNFDSISSTGASMIMSSNNPIVFRKNKKNILEITDSGSYIDGNLGVSKDAYIKGNAYVGNTIYGKCTQAVNADTLDGQHSEYFMKADGSNNTNPAIVIQTAAPTGRTGCLWIDSNGIARYWNGTNWTPISNVWKA